MSDNIDPNARREVNNAIMEAGGENMALIVNTAISSVKKRRKLEAERQEREGAWKTEMEKKDAASNISK
ncbi:hypothetical protein BDV26DRAFT_290007 [Aspergillus bertholletiae]|uniref:Uncharacterized protein n=1 Tax=Aspergillus bertholletiae TaxID=1226010 RepID=A0A5N7BGL9_9EURO|nr:hypothetical protein BDV26DRAFT_290007 [Aspergillus bertholletiae]